MCVTSSGPTWVAVTLATGGETWKLLDTLLKHATCPYVGSAMFPQSRGDFNAAPGKFTSQEVVGSPLWHYFTISHAGVEHASSVAQLFQYGACRVQEAIFQSMGVRVADNLAARGGPFSWHTW